MEGNGSVSGPGNYAYGKYVDIHASPSTGFEFSNWEGSEIENKLSLTTRVRVLQDTDLKAVFLPKRHFFTVSVNHPAFGNAQIIQSGPFRNGNIYDIFARPNPGYNFSHWSSTNDALYMLESNRSVSSKVNLQNDAALFANFYEIQHKLNVLMGSGGNSVSPASGNYGVNQIVPISAVPSDGYKFIKWHDPGGIIDDPYKMSSDVNMSKATGDQTILANFARKDYDITLTAGKGGNVIINISNGPWYHFESYEIQAIPNQGYKFVSWNGNQASINSLSKDNNFSRNQINLTQDVILNAHFAPENYLISVLTREGGQATGSGQYSIENIPQISAVADEGWEFSHWEGNATFLTKLSSDKSPIATVALSDAPPTMSFEAVFKRPVFQLSVECTAGGTVNRQPNFELDVKGGTQISLQAQPQKGWSFDFWQGVEESLISNEQVDIIINSNSKLVASFKKNTYTLQITQSTLGESSGTGSYQYDELRQISTTPKKGYLFEKWTGDIEYVQSNLDANTTVRIPDSNISLTPVFKIIPIEVSVSVVGNGSVIGSGSFPPNEFFSLEARGSDATQLAPRGFDLLRWSWVNKQGIVSYSTDNPLILSSDKNLEVEAEFYPVPPDEVQLNLASVPTASGITYDDPDKRKWNLDTYTIDRNVSAVPLSGFYFKGWSIDSDTKFEPSWRHPQVVVSPKSASNLTAHFEQINHDFNVLFDDSQGTISNFKTSYPHGETFTLQVTPHNHFDFDGWVVTKGNNFSVNLSQSSIRNGLDNIYINQKECPKLFLYRGFSYNFNVFLESQNKFYLSSRLHEKKLYESEYLSGVENSRVDQGTLKFVVPNSAPDHLYYKLSANNSLFGEIQILNYNLDDIISFPDETNISPTISSNLEISANFKNKQYNVVVSSENGGEVQSVQSTFVYQDIIPLIATPNKHYEFVRWEGSDQILDPSSPSTTLSVTGSTNVRAVFTPKLYPLNIRSEPEGTASFKTTNNLLAFPYGTKVNIEAQPALGFRFMGWQGDVLATSNVETSLIIDENNEVVATIATDPLQIKLEKIVLDHEGTFSNLLDGGSVSGATVVQKNSQYSYNATVNEGYNFLGWFDENQNIISNLKTASISFSGSTSLFAKFQLKSFNLDISISPKYFGNLWWDDLITLQELNYTFPYNHQVSIIAKPLGENQFNGWELSPDTKHELNDNEISFSLTEDTLLTARFIPPAKPVLVIDIFPPESGTALGSGTKNTTGLHYIFATPNPGFVFKEWQGQSIQDSKSPETNIEFDQNTTIIAIFEEAKTSIIPDNVPIETQQFNLEVFSSDKNHGLTNPSGINTYAKGKIAILAEAKPGYYFSHWDGDGIIDISEASTHINLTNNASIAAIFRPNSSQQKYVNVEKSIKTYDHQEVELLRAEEGGTIIGSSSFAVGQEPIFKTYTFPGFKFLRWENEFGQVLSSLPEIKYNSQTDFSLVSIFKKKSYTVSISSQPKEIGKIQAEGIGTISSFTDIFAHGETISMSAKDTPGYKFLNWQLDGVALENAKNKNLQVKISKDLQITANYYPVNSVRLKTEVFPLNSGWIIGGGEFSYNSNHLILAKANPGYKFSTWEGNQINDKESSQTNINLDQDLTVRAVFVPDLSFSGGEVQSNPGLHSLTVKSNNTKFGTAFGSGIYGTGWVPIEALAEQNYEFSHWSGQGLEDNLRSKTNLLLKDDTSVTAHFKEKPLFSESKTELNGWKESAWFGSYWNLHPEKWAYHLDLGWVFAEETTNSSYWVWISKLNDWYWIDKNTYPYIYHANSLSWLYILLPNPDPINGIIVYVFKNNNWIRQN